MEKRNVFHEVFGVLMELQEKLLDDLFDGVLKIFILLLFCTGNFPPEADS